MEQQQEVDYYLDRIGGNKKERFKLWRNRSHTLGRSTELDIVVNSSYCSRFHLVLTITFDNIIKVKDNGTPNGTFINNDQFRDEERTVQVGDRIGVGCDPQHCIGDNQFVVFELCRRIKNEVILLSDDDDDCVVNVPASVQPAVAAAAVAAVDHPAEIHSIVDSTDDDDEDDDLDNASNVAHDFDMEMSQRHMRDFKQEQIEWDDYCVGVDRIKNESVDYENNNDDNSFHDYSIDDDVVDLCSDDELEILSQRWMPLSQISSNKDVSGPSRRRRQQSTIDLPAFEKKRKIDFTIVKKEMMVPDSVDSTGVVVVEAAADPSPTIEVMEWDWNDEQIRAVFSKEPSAAEPVVQPAAAAADESIESDDNAIHQPGTVRAAHRIFDNETDQSDASSINIQRPKAARIGHRIVDTEPEPIDNETAAARDERKESSHRRKSSSSSSRASSSKHVSKKSSKHSKEKSNGHKKSDRIASTSKIYQPTVLLHKITAETSRPAAPEPKIVLKQITSAEPKKLPEMLQTAPPPPPASAPILPPQPSSNAITKMPHSSLAAPTPASSRSPEQSRCAPITNRRRTQLIEAKPLEKRRQSCSLNRIKTALKMDDQLKKFKTNIPIGQRTSSSSTSGHGSSKSSKKDVKENRSSKLRQIAEAQKANVVKEPKSKTKPKVKLTVNNRGTFLTEQFDQVPKKTTKTMEQQLAAGKNRSLVHEAVTPPILEHLVNASMGLSTAAEPIEIPSVFPKSSLKPRVSHVSGGRRPSVDTNRISIDTAYETAPVPSSAFAPQPSEMVTTNSVQPAPREPMPAAAAPPPAAGTAASPQQKNLSDYTFIFEPTPRPNSILVNIVQKRKPLRCVRFAENIAEIREFVADANEILERRNHLQNVLQMNAGMSKKRPTNSGLDQAAAVVNDPILDVMKWDPKWLKKLVAIRNAPPPPVNGLDFLLMPLTHKYDSIATFIGTMIPLMKLELWQTMADDHDYAATSNNDSICIVRSVHKSANNNGRLNLFCEMKDKMDRLNVNDIVILSYRTKTNVYEFFAIVTDLRFVRPSALQQGQPDREVQLKLDAAEMLVNRHLIGTRSFTVNISRVTNLRADLKMFLAVLKLATSPLCKLILNPLLSAIAPASVDVAQIKYMGFNTLNEEQERTLKRVYHRCSATSEPSITLIDGPPGTGKSRLIANLVVQLIYGRRADTSTPRRPIIVCAHSNAAVDSITLKLLCIRTAIDESHDKKTKIKLVRFGVLDKMDESVRKVSVQSLSRSQRSNRIDLTEEIRNLDLRLVALKLRSSSSKQQTAIDAEIVAVQKRLEMLKQKQIESDDIRTESQHYKTFLTNADVVCTTLGSCTNMMQYLKEADICIVDEATQCTEPHTLLPLLFGVRSLILVGDTNQLPATVLSPVAIAHGLSTSLFSRFHSSFHLQTIHKDPIFYLRRQYRMCESICSWPNGYFYDNRLITDAASTTDINFPLLPYNVLTLDHQQSINRGNSRSISNASEADFVVALVRIISEELHRNNSIGIITPYAKQKGELTHKLSQLAIPKLTVNTIDSYQGQERDVIIISNARTEGIGFLENPQRLNVALTRARKCLILCGNFRSLRKNPLWKSLLNDAEGRKCVKKINTQLDTETTEFRNHIKQLLFKE